MSEKLELKVTVEGTDLDAKLANFLRAGAPAYPGFLRSHSGTEMVRVTDIKRADGQPIGAEAEFERYWDETHVEEYEAQANEKSEAREAFMYAIKYANRIR